MERAERQALFAEIERVAGLRGWDGLTPVRPGGGVGPSRVVTARILLAAVLVVPALAFLKGLFYTDSMLFAGGSSVIAVLFMLGLSIWFAVSSRVELKRFGALAVEQRRKFEGTAQDYGVIAIDTSSGERIECKTHKACYHRVSVPSSGFAYVEGDRLLDFKTLEAS